MAILLVLTAFAYCAQAQSYIGYVYPAGGQQGTTVRVTLAGQGLEGVNSVFVSGQGIKARMVEYNKRMGNQEISLISEQLKELKAMPPSQQVGPISNLMARIDKIIQENVATPACASLANRVIAEITIAPDAKPGIREIRIGTQRGISNPLVFNIGQLPEVSKEPKTTSPLVTLGKEEQSLRLKKRDPAKQPASADMMTTTMMMGGPGAQSDMDDDEVAIKVPCTVNGQITQGAVDRYRFEARKGQRLVIKTQARELIPYIADAVPGWFQAVILLCDAKGRELAYNDDYRFKPDPVILFEVPEDGEYLLAIHDAIYRGREDFVYRITIGELPFVTSIFPLGGRVDTETTIEMKGWNLTETSMTVDSAEWSSGVYQLTARGKDGLLADPFLFAEDNLPDCTEKDHNDQQRTAQVVTLPVIVNGRIEHPGDHDLFKFEGKAGDEVVAEVYARRLDSPLDSLLKLTDSNGKKLALNDDREDSGTGLNTHHADSYIRATLPTNGTFYIHLTDAQHKGGVEYGYRLRISQPQPDFALRIVPSYVNIRSNSSGSLSVFAIRQDGFTNSIKLGLKDYVPGFDVTGLLPAGTALTTRVTIKTRLAETASPVNLIIEGCASNGLQKIEHDAIPAEDRMQAFLWRHLVPVQELKAFVYNPPPPPPKAETPKPEAVKK